ncbi:MAG: TrkA family potassium uptake protein [Lachnospiraceae bacterium]|nr:TrkA family potassium uptake protein [Lachnospiraceae bacterium]
MKSVLLIGLNNFGIQIAKQLARLGHQVMACDRDEENVDAVLPFVTDARIGDSTKEVFLSSLGINNYDLCIVAVEKDFQSSLETTSLLKELGGRYVVARADSDVQAKFLLRNGADDVIDPEKQVAKWSAVRYTADHILDYIELDEEHGIFEIPVPEEWVGRTIGKIDIRKKYGITIMAVRENGKMNLSVMPDTVLHREMTMFVLGERRRVRKFFHI